METTENQKEEISKINKNVDASKFIEAITEFVPTFFSPGGMLLKESEKKNNGSVLETIIQSENFFADHPNSFLSDETKNTYVINKLGGLAKKWGLSLLVDGTLSTLKYEEFKNLLLENFDSGNEKKQKYILINKLINLQQQKLGKAAEYTIEFRKIASRLGWPDSVFIDIIGKGLIDQVRDEFDKVKNPKTLFEATNIIINIDKKCYIENSLRGCSSEDPRRKSKTFGRKKYELNKTSNKNFFKSKFNNKQKKEVLSANYTPDKSTTMVTTFVILLNERKQKINFLIDSGSAKSFMCKNFIIANRIPTSGLTSPINIQLPNSKSMTIKQVTKPVKIKFLDHEEKYEFLVGNLQLNGISGILGRDWLSKHNPYIDFKNNKIYFLERFCSNHCPSAKGNKFVFHSSEVAAPMVDDTTDSIIPSSISEDELYENDICGAMPEIKKELSRTEKIINKYYKYLTLVFKKQEADKLPPHRPYDISIDLIPGSQLYFGPIYSLSQVEMSALKDYIKENIIKGFIRKSRSPAGAPILFVRKPDGTLRLCVDYRRLNAVTIRNSYPLPRINDLIEAFKGSKIFSKLDLRSAYNLVRVKEGHEYLTAFRTPIGHFEYLVMPFGLRNAPSVFQHFIQDVLGELIGDHVQVYLDDIIIYSNNLEDHIVHVKNVLSLLIKNGLYVKKEKCEFHVKETTFLGFTISVNGLTMDQNKVKSIIEWPTPKNVKELQSFLGLCNFYRRFIKNFAEIMEPLRILLKKNSEYIWNDQAENAFKNLKKSFLSNEILIFPDYNKEFIVETDASNYAIGCVLSQISENDQLLHPIAFYSRSLNSNEKNYTIYDKELLAVITAFDVWRHHLEGAKYPIQVITDHKNLLYLKKPQHLNQRQIRWSLFLSKFDFRISYRPGTKSGKPDSLSRRPDYQENNFPIACAIPNDNPICCTAYEKIDKLIDLQKQDKFCKETMSKLKSKSKEIKSSLFSLIRGVLHFQGRIIVPSLLRTKILQSFHDSPLGGHQGIHKTMDKLKRYYWWPNMRKDVENYILSCETCGRCKTRRHKPYGKLLPLPVPKKPWEIIGVDFIVSLPSSQDCSCIMVVSDHLTKMIHLVPCSDVPSADLTAKLLLFNVFRYHGFPKTIVSDHGSQFSSEFWTSLCSALHIQPNLATAHHQQSNGQIERANAVVEQYLRCYCSSAQNEWCYYLPLCEFAYNNSLHQSIGVSPFYANFGFNPNSIIDSPPILLKDNASVLTRDWSAHFQSLQAHLVKAKEDFKKYNDLKKQHGPNFNINNKVWLKRYYFTNEPAKKLASQYLGPFRITEKLKRMNYRLELPSNLHLHPIFHISQLEPYVERNQDLKEHSNYGNTS